MLQIHLTDSEALLYKLSACHSSAHPTTWNDLSERPVYLTANMSLMSKLQESLSKQTCRTRPWCTVRHVHVWLQLCLGWSSSLNSARSFKNSLETNIWLMQLPHRNKNRCLHMYNMLANFPRQLPYVHFIPRPSCKLNMKSWTALSSVPETPSPSRHMQAAPDLKTLKRRSYQLSKQFAATLTASMIMHLNNMP